MSAEKIGIYVLRKQIGKGGMGAVYLAHDPTLQRPVAIKVLPAALAGDPDYVARFEREATSLAKIRHPNLVHIYAVGCDEGRHYIAMEYIRGHPLAKVIRKQGRIPYRSAVRALGQVLSALDKVHGAGIVHRDLKSGNIMIDEDHRAILMDFGLAKPQHDQSVTTEHTIIGTPEYMAPELAEGGEADVRSDIYALGIVLYEMLTGRVPFRGQSAVATFRQHIEQPPTPVREVCPDLPPEFDAIVAKALAKRPEERYQSASEMAAAMAAVVRSPELTRLARAHPASSTAATVAMSAGPTRTMESPPAPAARPRWLVPAAAGGGALLLLVAVLAARALLPGRPSATAGPDPDGRTSAMPGTGAAPGTAAAPGTSAPAPPGPMLYGPPSKHRFAITGGGIRLTGRIIAIDPEMDTVIIELRDGSKRNVPYHNLLRIEKLGGD